MKNLYPLLILLFLSLSTYAQSPEKMSYQAVVRDANNTLVSNQTVGMQISILQSTISGTVVYTETHSVDTNINGLVSLEIGNGSSSDDFSTIDWSAGPYFIKTETDPTGGSSYTITGTSQLMSVPYAMYAKSSGSSIPGPEGPAGPEGAEGPAGFDGNSSSWKSLGTVGLPTTGVQPGEFSLVYDPATWANAGNTTHQLHIGVNDAYTNDFVQWIKSVRPYDIITIRSTTNSAEAHYYEVLPVTSATASPPFNNNGPHTAFYGTAPNFFSARLRLINATSVPSTNGGPFATGDLCHISFTKSGVDGLCNGFEGVYKGTGSTLPISTPPTYGAIMFNSPVVGSVTKIIFYPQEVNQENLEDYFSSMMNFGYNGNRGLLTIASPPTPNSNRYTLVYQVGSTVLVPNSSGTAIQEIVVEVQFVGGIANANSTSIPFVNGQGLCHSFSPTGTSGKAKASLVTTAQPPGTTVPNTTANYGEINTVYFDVQRGSVVYQFDTSDGNTSFLELVVDPPGSTTNSTTQPRLTITNAGSTYPR